MRVFGGVTSGGGGGRAAVLRSAEPTKTPRQTPTPTECHRDYVGCLPIVDDLDCDYVRAHGLAPVRVTGIDQYRLDGDNDGWGCE